MESTRQQKYGKLIQKELSDIFLHDTKSLFGSAFITVTTVRVSPDLALAKVYLSFMMVENKQAMLDMIVKQTKPIRKMLGDRIKKQARIIPALAFYIDDTVDYANKMNELFSKIVIPKKEEDDSQSE
ncbi:MAG TPA: 30S ribosome-binding factor RbfA [Cytophagaceae bacterium]|jgi:ribosome-binding factor A|nr:30S ribosome-binding factor RbfA [Cytophagaceae bacterium]